jgi:hypothetical protein
MNRKFVISVVFAFLLSSAAFADIGQFQGFILGSNDSASTSGGAVLNLSSLTVQNNQLATDPTGRVTTFQIGVGSLNQGASASGLDGLFGAELGGLAGGAQLQLQGGSLWNLGSQDQDLDANLWQDVYKIGGAGSALAAQAFVGGQVQIIATPYGASANIQYLGIAQYNSTLGGPDTNAVVSGGVDVGVGQGSAG